MRKQNVFFLSLLAWLLLTLVLTQCAQEVQAPFNDKPTEEETQQLPEDIFSFDSDTFDTERAAWEAQGFTQYAFSYGVWKLDGTSDGCAAFVEVKNNIPTITTDGAEFNKLMNEELKVLDTTISGLYTKLAALAQKARQDYAVGTLIKFDLSTGFNKTWHYPTFISCLYQLTGQADIKVGISINKFSGPQEPISSYQFDQATFERERALWNAQNLEAYSYVADMKNLGRRPCAMAIIDVTAGNFSTVTEIQKPPVMEAEGVSDLDYMEALFGTSISQLYDKLSVRAQEGKALYDAKQIRYFKLEIEYHKDFHYPVAVIYTGMNFLDTLDDILTLSITDFTMFPNQPSDAPAAP